MTRPAELDARSREYSKPVDVRQRLFLIGSEAFHARVALYRGGIDATVEPFAADVTASFIGSLGPGERARCIVLVDAVGEAGNDPALAGRVAGIATKAAVIACIGRDVGDRKSLLELARAGIRGFVILGIDDLGRRLHETFAELQRNDPLALVTRALLPTLPRVAQDACEWAARNGKHDMTVPGMAFACGTTPRRLQRLFKQHLGITPADWIGFVRVLNAVHERAFARNWDDVAGRLEFSAGTHIGRMIRRWERRLGCDLRGPGSLERAAAALRPRLTCRGLVCP